MPNDPVNNFNCSSQFYDPKLRVLLVTPALSPGGAERMLATLYQHAQTVRYTAIVTSYKEGLTLQPEFNCPVIPSEETSIPSLCSRIHEVIASHGADLIFYWGFGRLTPDTPFPIPTVQVMHCSGKLGEEIHKDHLQWIAAVADSSANFLSAVSNSAALAYRKTLRDNFHVEVIHNGTDLERTHPILGRDEQRKRWKLPHDAKVVLYNGRLSASKGVHKLLEAFAYLPSHWHLILHGWGHINSSENEELDIHLRTHRLALGFLPRIIRPIPRLTHLGDIYAASDVAVLASRSEAFPLTMLEAWQSGTPLVCTPFQTLLDLEAEFSPDEPLAHHIPFNCSPVQLSQAIQTAYHSDLESRTRPQTIARKHFTGSQMAQRWEDYFYRCHRAWFDRSRYGEMEVAEPQPPNTTWSVDSEPTNTNGTPTPFNRLKNLLGIKVRK